MLVKKIIALLGIFILISCETNPPTSPMGPSVKTGEVLFNVTFTVDQNLNVSKTVLLEDFANVSCTPCVISNRIIESLTHSTFGTEKLVPVKFPTNFPSSVDPFYLSAKPECDFRMSFYNIFFAPTVIIDGILRPTPTDSISIKQAVESRLSATAEFDLDISRQANGGGLIINLDITAKDTVNLNFSDIVLHFTVVETEIEFSNPPGSNGETKFFNVLRLQLPNTQGYSLTELKLAGQQGISFSYEETIDENWDINKLNVVVFLQNKLTKEVYQVGSTM